jgi:3-isopropylmalate/(R)-2-methylmalate dehydratase large subunit
MTQTLFDKIWNAHVVVARDDGTNLLWIDRHLVHDGGFHGFDMLNHSGRTLRRPDLTFGVADHYVPSHSRSLPIADPEGAALVARLEANARRHGFDSMGLDDPRQGIVHVVGPEQGITLPGLTLVCGDSHTATHGAFGTLAFGIGASEVGHVLATQTLWQRKPKRMRITVDGVLGPHVSAKDVVLAIIARIGAAGAVGYAIEYAGSAIRALSMEGRMTLCNMTIEAGSRTGMIAPDDTAFQYLYGRPRAPKGALWDSAVMAWRLLPTDDGAVFDTEVALRAADIAPTVT